MSYKAVFLDIDGTILPHGKQIANETKGAIARLKEKGMHVVIATGRAPYFAQPVIADLGIDSMIFFNGSYALHEGNVIHETPIDKKVLEKLHIKTMEHQHPLTYLAGTEFRATALEHPYVIEAFSQDPWKPELASHTFWQEQHIYQLFLHCEAQEERLYQEHIPELDFRRWSQSTMRTCDVNLSTGTKATGIEKILERIGIAPDEAVAFGDGLNDVEMLTMVGMGVAMGNAAPEVQAYANMVTKTAEEHGVKYGLEKLGLL
ncbi:Cof-type HAD-IIB family hydrolase [Ectobacillus sp. JY-23]|uniref:Cof-type HAD-IIB family hydrolase n=1 Tax=Ectobacillus sp. JY-23 TaxID=2933872 RepID=UPI001FF2F939|nr:Cof-type HAD-IIB family hydrolase [Ectobacillus sp. JY-23]UOY91790.1 Cof-type HAD-IIB family hydrolase [Ectobacillus sp. JY-23]